MKTTSTNVSEIANELIKRYSITHQDIADMEEWLTDCIWANPVKPELRSSYSTVFAICRHWDGGNIHPVADFINAQNRRPELLS